MNTGALRFAKKNICRDTQRTRLRSRGEQHTNAVPVCGKKCGLPPAPRRKSAAETLHFLAAKFLPSLFSWF